MELLNNLVGITNEFLWSKVLIIMLIVLGIYFTFRTNFVQFRFFGEMFRLLGDGAKGEKKEGAVSSFQAFCISTASRVGTGNIAGIAMAVVAGGPGSVFWMWLIALIGSASSFVESTLAQ
ncbi:MAG: alanine:cation symporter family protein, partial [Clostridiales bacterium]